jgi:hypothetical protein
MQQTYQQAIPFIIAFVGVFADYITTSIGLQRGFVETNLQYNPALALMMFWGCLLLLTITSQRTRTWEIGKTLFASTSLLGATNNILVLTGMI